MNEPDDLGIACPTCGARTEVLATRLATRAFRRRRICSVVTCGTRVTTLEMVAPAHKHGDRLMLALVPVSLIQGLRDLARLNQPDLVSGSPAEVSVEVDESSCVNGSGDVSGDG